ncbi:MAG: type II toxin-antitoxin system VapC family toxin [Bdellovibrionota bacterium]
MSATYLDASVILRLLLREPGGLPDWQSPGVKVTSELAEVECLRTLDRMRLTGPLTGEDAFKRRESLRGFLQGVWQVELTRPILQRAAQPLPVALGTLDAIHLSTALYWRETQDEDLILATHDQALAKAARACGIETKGT